MRETLALVSPWASPLFKQLVAKKVRQQKLEEAIVEEWDGWPVSQDEAIIGELFVYTDGSAELSSAWPQTLCAAGWGYIVMAIVDGEPQLLGVSFGPVGCAP